MPNPNSPGSSVSMSGAPGADISFDDLFPVEPENLGGPQGQPGTPPAGEPQAPPVAEPPQDQFFLRNSDGSIVYRTPEDAIQGISHKDSLVNKYRSFLKEQGIDPDNLQPVRRAEPQAQPKEDSPFEYLGHEDKVFDDLSAAVAKGDKRAYGEVLRKYNQETLMSQIAPVVPLLGEVARQRAVREVSQEAPDFNQFLGSQDYNDTLSRLPRLKEAIHTAENNFQAADSLGELYRITWLVNRALRKPEPVVQAQPAPPLTAPRPTLQTSSMAPPQPGVAADLSTTQGRKQLIADLEGKGIKDRPW